MKALLVILLATLTVGCTKNITSTEYPDLDKTIIVYMVADNNLNTNAYNDIQEMEYALSGIDQTANLIVYIDKNYDSQIGSTPQILRIVADTDISTIASTVVKQYSEQDSTDPTVVSKVLDDIMTTFPAEQYGLILWSHSTGWLEAAVSSTSASYSTADYGGATMLSFGNDNDNEVNNDILSQALPTNLDFIWFDCCLMGNAETIYEYRNNADIIIASPNEVLSYGMPYEKTMPYLIDGDYTGAAKAFFDHYSNQEKDLVSNYYVDAYATIAVYQTDQIENLATVISEQTQRCGGYPTNPNVSSVQRMAYDSDFLKLFFDLSDGIDCLFDQQAVDAVDDALDNLILYKAATPTFDYLSMNKYCGITCYLPRTNISATSDDNYYSTLDWAKAVGWD
ncbi:MAG: clostripain-related cysteine peptidase [Rikenellaceae bacterium]